MSEENVEIVRRSLDAWNRGEFDAWGQDSHPNIEFFSAITWQAEGDMTAFRGPTEMRQFWDEWHSLWDLRVDISEIRDLGDTVVALGGMTMRGRASGVPVDSPVAYVFEFEDGLFRTVRAYLNPSEALKAVGLAE
jgi:ketosteroid isomerase-like protein